MPHSVSRNFWYAFVLVFTAVVAVSAQEESNEKVVMAHYMPWYASKDISGDWGWHWTMNHFDPDQVRWDGRRRVASQDYPLIGLYDSAEDDALECQVQLMKIAGIDGVIIDWYGIKDFNDYQQLHENTLQIVKWVKKAGLRFAICYEDQSIGQMVKRGELTAEEAEKHGKEVLNWVDANWFSDPAYLKVEDQPVLLVFGPQYFEGEQWTTLREDLNSKPLIYALPHLVEKSEVDGAFGWPPVDGGKTVYTATWRKYLEKLYDANKSNIAVAFPGFHDIYKQAGLHDSYGYLDARDGETLAETLELGLESQASILQIATWNDYGEGTVIEPTWKFGYRHLETVQKQVGELDSASLRLPVQLYQLKKRAKSSELNAELATASKALLDLETDKAQSIIEAVESKLRVQPARFFESPAVEDSDYRLAKDILYHVDTEVSDYAKRRCRLDVYHPANEKNFATVIWFHGGGISKGERSIPLPLREQGIAVVTANYRLSPKVQSPTYIEDAAAAVAWTLQNIEKFGGSKDDVYLSGHSAGGYLASMVGMDERWLKAHDLDPGMLAGLVPFSGHTITHFTVRKERGIDGKQAIVDDLAPLYHVRKDVPPMMLITGDRDLELLGRYEETAYFWRMMQVVGHPECELHELKGLNHGDMPMGAFPLLLEFVRR